MTKFKPPSDEWLKWAIKAEEGYIITAGGLTMTMAEKFKISKEWTADSGIVKSFHDDGEAIYFFKDGSIMHHSPYADETYKSCEEWLNHLQRRN